MTASKRRVRSAEISTTTASTAETPLPEPAIPRLRSSNGLLFLAVIGFGALIRLYNVTDPPLDYHSFRQTQTLMMARNFYLHGIDILHPRVDWLPTDRPPAVAPVGGTEFPIVPALTALLYHVVGDTHWAGRVVSMLCALAGSIYFYVLVARLVGMREALLATVFLTVSPMFFLTSRVQMPEAFAFATAFAGLAHFDSWLTQNRRRDLVLTTVFTACMLLGKPQLAVYGLAWLALALMRRGPSVMKDYRLYVIGVLAVIPTGLYVPFSSSLTERSGVSFTIDELFEYGFLGLPSYWTAMFKWTALWGVGVGVFALGLIGLVWPTPRRAMPLMLAWIAAGIVMLILIPGGSSSNPHYLIAFAPPFCVLAARVVLEAIALGLSPRGLQGAWWLSPSAIAIVATTAILLVPSLYAAKLLSTPVALADYRCGMWLKENTPPDTLVLYSYESPAAMYFSERSGWICWYEGNGISIEFGPETINKVARLGARVLAITAAQIATTEQPDDPFTDIDPSFRDVLYNTYQHHDGDGFTIFYLDKPAVSRQK